MSGVKRKREYPTSNSRKKRGTPEPNSDLVMDLSDSEGESGSQESNEENDIFSSDVDRPTDFPAKSRTESRAKKAPTGNEVRQMKEATELFMSNTFKLQIDALLPRVRPIPSHIPPLEAFLLRLHEHILDIQPIPPLHPMEAARKLLAKGIAVPYPWPAPTAETKWTVAYEKPSGLKLVGSWANKISVKHRDDRPFGIDLAVEMPDSLFQDKDFLNFRYFHKRAFYLSAIAASVQAAFDLDAMFESTNNDARRTTLLLRHKTEFTKLHGIIRIIPTLPHSSPISKSKLSPGHSNIRAANTTSSEPAAVASPIYNNDILLSFIPSSLLLTIHSFKNEVPSFPTAVTLLRVWANQRGYGKADTIIAGFDGLSTWWACLIIVLVRGEDHPVSDGKQAKPKTLGRGLSSYQLFRATLDFLARHDFTKEPVFMKSEGQETPKFSRSEWSQQHSAIFIDPSGTVNLLAGVPLSSLELLRHDAQTTLQLLGSSPRDPFDTVFLHDLRSLHTRFDVVLQAQLDGAKPRTDIQALALDHGSDSNALIYLIACTIRQALGNRAKVAAVLHAGPQPRPLKQAGPSQPSSITVGIILDQTQALRLVDHGPAADDVSGATEVFREFWGEKAELRRFKDGSIQESVVWEIGGPDDRPAIPSRIVEFALSRHFGIVSIISFQPMFGHLLELPLSLTTIYSAVEAKSSSSVGFRPCSLAFDSLVKSIKAIDDLPLALVTASPIGEYLRYSSVFPPIPLDLERFSSLPDCARYIPALEVVLQFEKSSRWPDDLEAIQKVKLAFFEAIGRTLVISTVGVRTQIALETGVSTIHDNSSLEILMPEGIAFRARIYHDREKTLLERLLEDNATLPPRRSEAAAALELHSRRFIHSPRHHAAVMAIHHRHPSYSRATRLVKRWLSAHLVFPHMSAELVELICAHVYLVPGSHSPPATGPTGFSRAIRLLADWDWKTEPLIVPIYSAAGLDASLPVVFPIEKRSEAETAFASSRAIDPSLSKYAWVVVTEEDVKGTVWGGRGPARFVADRIKDVAKATLQCLEEGMRQGNLLAKALFEHPMTDYDFLIHLEPLFNPRYLQNVAVDSSIWAKNTKYVNLLNMDSNDNSGDENLLIEFDPVMNFVRDLEQIYGDTMALFFDPFGGTVIGGVWNPQLSTARPFRVFLGFSSIPQGKNVKKPLVSVNQEAILIEVTRMGKGLIKEITRRQ